MATEFQRRTIVTLCGSTRFSDDYQQANLTLTLAGKSDEELDAIKDELDSLHRDMIAMSDEVFFLNVVGYMGKSTRSEWLYALRQGKKINFLEPETVPKAAWDVMRMYAQVQAIRRVEAATNYHSVSQSDIDAIQSWSQTLEMLRQFSTAVDALATDWPEAKGSL